MRRIQQQVLSYQRGFSLIEIMIGMTLSLALTTAIVQIFLANKTTYRMQEANSRLQENGRAAIDFMTRDIRNAGFLGCKGDKTITESYLNSTGSDFAWDFTTPLQGNEATSTTAWLPTLDSAITTPLGGNDIITIRRANGKAIPVLTNSGGASAGTADVAVASSKDLSQYDIVMLTDCVNSAIFQITNIATGSGSDTLEHKTGAGTPGNKTASLKKDFEVSGEVHPMATISYFVRTTGTASGRPGLWRQVNSGAAQEFIEGVEAMQIRYGMDTDSDDGKTPNQYVTADSITGVDWTKVTTVRIDMLLASLDDYLLDRTESLTFVDGKTYGTGDRRLRRTFSTVVKLRNRTK